MTTVLYSNIDVCFWKDEWTACFFVAKKLSDTLYRKLSLKLLCGIHVWWQKIRVMYTRSKPSSLNMISCRPSLYSMNNRRCNIRRRGWTGTFLQAILICAAFMSLLLNVILISQSKTENHEENTKEIFEPVRSIEKRETVHKMPVGNISFGNSGIIILGESLMFNLTKFRDMFLINFRNDNKA